MEWAWIIAVSVVVALALTAAAWLLFGGLLGGLSPVWLLVVPALAGGIMPLRGRFRQASRRVD